jgi:hypothetical protein
MHIQQNLVVQPNIVAQSSYGGNYRIQPNASQNYDYLSYIKEENA